MPQTTRNTKRRERMAANRANGLCSCGQVPIPGLKTCQRCRKANKAAIAKNKAAGKCTCGRLRVDGYMQCEACSAYRQQRNQARMRRYREAGLCYFCGQPAVLWESAKRRQGAKHTRAAKTLCITCSRNERQRHHDVKAEVFAAYGGYRCTCCGETEPLFLQIDHINNDGASHRRAIGGSSGLYRWLKRNNYPAGFQVLCANCNVGKQRNGGVCPHHSSQEANNGIKTEQTLPLSPS